MIDDLAENSHIIQKWRGRLRIQILLCSGCRGPAARRRTNDDNVHTEIWMKFDPAHTYCMYVYAFFPGLSYRYVSRSRVRWGSTYSEPTVGRGWWGVRGESGILPWTMRQMSQVSSSIILWRADFDNPESIA